jgi:hypothetical protein
MLVTGVCELPVLLLTCAFAFKSWVLANNAANIPAASIPASSTDFLSVVFMFVAVG